ncbi:hypothetical protein CWI38_0655p0020 [Hamiltosporidium tvaerminnensis]|uniref:Uncharacterized protein n=1 Tax=Hamiltosporidium tvaerminnensis TaxID=1176355 RepID=A0A4Q9LY97_9MICR|nr:hypothetical protein CWI38_0655p0020 [Hamiltosporidium tvaerminnensis]
MTGYIKNTGKNQVVSISNEEIDNSLAERQMRCQFEIEEEVAAKTVKKNGLKLRECVETNKSSQKDDFFRNNEFKIMIGLHKNDSGLINKNLPVARFLIKKIMSNEVLEDKRISNIQNISTDTLNGEARDEKSVLSVSEIAKKYICPKASVEKIKYFKDKEIEKIPGDSEYHMAAKTTNTFSIVPYKVNKVENQKRKRAKRRLTRWIKPEEIVGLKENVKPENKKSLDSESIPLNRNVKNIMLEQKSVLNYQNLKKEEEFVHCNVSGELEKGRENNNYTIQKFFIKEAKKINIKKEYNNWDKNHSDKQEMESDFKIRSNEAKIVPIEDEGIEGSQTEKIIQQNKERMGNLGCKIINELEETKKVLSIVHLNIDQNKEINECKKAFENFESENKNSNEEFFIDKILMINSSNIIALSKETDSKQCSDNNFDGDYSKKECLINVINEKTKLVDVQAELKEEYCIGTEKDTNKETEYEFDGSECKMDKNSCLEVENFHQPNNREIIPVDYSVKREYTGNEKSESKNMIRRSEKQEILYKRVLKQIVSRENVYIPPYNKKRMLKKNILTFKKSDVMSVDTSLLDREDRIKIEEHYRKLLDRKIEQNESGVKKWFKSLFGCYRIKRNRIVNSIDNFIFKLIDFLIMSNISCTYGFIKEINHADVKEKIKKIEKQEYYKIEETNVLTNLGVVLFYIRETMNGIIPHHYRKILLNKKLKNDKKKLDSILDLMKFAIGYERIKMIEKIKNLIMNMKCNSEDPKLVGHLIDIFSKAIFPLKENANLKNDIHVLNVINFIFQSDLRSISLCTYYEARKN